MNGYPNSRGSLLPRVRARSLSLAILSTFVLAACGGGGGGGDDDGGGTPPPPANQAPSANAGTDKTAAFPEPVSLTGSGTDPENATLTYTWSQQSGPGTTAFSAASAATTNATFSAPGNYTLRLTVSDGTNSAFDDAVVAIPALYPSATWTTATPADVKLNAAKLDEARTYSQQTNPNGLSGGTGAVIRYGKLVYSWGDIYSQSAERYDVKSTTKSIGGLALLFALHENQLTLDTTAQAILGAQFASPPTTNQSLHADWVQAINVRHLATHTAGFVKPDAAFAADDDGELVSAPGTTWRYSDAGLNWLADVLTFKYSSDLYTVVKARVFDPLGISSITGAGGAASIRWRDNALRDPNLNVNGTPVPRRELAAGMFANIDAMARIGYFMLRKGNWNGTQLLPENLVALVHQPPLDPNAVTIDDPTAFPQATTNYGLLWWTNKSGANGCVLGVGLGRKLDLGNP
jgi:CubicO group peptidase (beta-lactamase class C family)